MFELRRIPMVSSNNLLFYIRAKFKYLLIFFELLNALCDLGFFMCHKACRDICLFFL